MADWQMRGAYEAKMEGMDMGKEGVSASPGREGEKGGMEGMQGMKGMGGMPGMETGSKKEMTGAETRQMNGLTLSLTTVPEKPKAGEVLLRLKLTDQAGKPVTNAQVLFVYTMPMPGMADSKATARHTKDGLYEGTVTFGMGGTWVVTVNLTVAGRPPVAEKFQFSVVGGGM
jgi:FixH.